MLRLLAFAALVALASATCSQIVGESPLAGSKCGASVDQTVGRAGWITKLNVYSAGGCVTGLKVTYGYNSKGAQLLGRASGSSKDLRLNPAKGEFIVKADLVTASCVQCITLVTSKGKAFTAGKCGSGAKTSAAAPEGAHLYALKGFFGKDCAAPALSLVWAKEGCVVKAIAEPLAVPATVEAPLAEAVAVAPQPQVAAVVEAPPAEAVAEAPAQAEATAEVVEEVTAQAPAEVVAEAPAEVVAAAPCKHELVFYGSNGLACDITTGKVSSTGSLPTPFSNAACVDLGPDTCKGGQYEFLVSQAKAPAPGGPDDGPDDDPAGGLAGSGPVKPGSAATLIPRGAQAMPTPAGRRLSFLGAGLLADGAAAKDASKYAQCGWAVCQEPHVKLPVLTVPAFDPPAINMPTWPKPFGKGK